MAENERRQIEINVDNKRKRLIIISVSIAVCFTAAIVAVLLLVPLITFDNDHVASYVSEGTSGTDSDSDQPSDAENETGDTQVSEDEVIDPVPFTGWIINNRGYTFVFKNRGLQQFNGTSTTAARYADAVNAVSAKFSAANVYSIIAPTAVEYVYSEIPIEYKQDFYCRRQSTFALSAAVAYADTVKSVDVIDTIGDHSDEYIYFYTDTNWTSKAAYYAYCAFAKQSGNTPVDIAECEEGVNSPFLGQFYTCTQAGTDQASFSASEALYYNSDSVYYYKLPGYDGVKIKGGYSLTGNAVSASRFGYYTFLGDEAEYFDITTESEGGTLLVIGDSSVPPMLQFLAANYSRIYYVNIEMYSDSLNFFNNADDVLIVNYATNAATPIYCEKLISLAENK